MSKFLATKELERIFKTYDTIYPELFKASQSIEKCNIIDAYFAGAMDRLTNKIDVDNYLKKYENEQPAQTERLPD